MTKFVAAMLAVLALLGAQPAWAQKTGGASEDPVYNYANSDDRMNAAVAEARRFYPLFLATFRADSEANRAAHYAVKLGLPTPDGGHEHVWIDNLRYEGETLVGALANIPDNLPGLAVGARVEIDDALVSDWSILTLEGMYGSFTTRIMLDDIPAGDAAQLRRVLTRDPIPAYWRT
jgi:uncharacterized protein YegJ (DUF2314 family)